MMISFRLPVFGIFKTSLARRLQGMLSVVIPAYNEEALVEKTASTLEEILSSKQIDYELLFVDDGSSDGTWNRIADYSKKSEKVAGISFSKNFGKESAIFAGLRESKGDCVVVIDCDLQHPPEKILEMYDLWQEGYEIVEGIKRSRGRESSMYSFAARSFYKMISNATGTDMSHASDFKLLDRKAVNVLINMPEKNAFFRALSSWVGFKSVQIEYDVRERQAGQTKWTKRSLAKYAIANVTSFSSAPMHLVTVLGVILFVFALIMTIITVCQKVAGVAMEGFTTVIIMLSFTSSIIMISLGIIGYYISRIFEELKGRPNYIIAECAGHITVDKKEP